VMMRRPTQHGKSHTPATSAPALLTRAGKSGNTTGMKVAISLPDDIFHDGERLAQQLGTSRSQLYARALADFVAQHGVERVTDAMNSALQDVGYEVDDFTRSAARKRLRDVEW